MRRIRTFCHLRLRGICLYTQCYCMRLGKQKCCSCQVALANINKRPLLTIQTLRLVVTSPALRKRSDMRKLELPAYRNVRKHSVTEACSVQ
jgi:hypothetical protein